MNANVTIRKHHDLFVARRNPFSARWATSPLPHRGPSASVHEPGDGISDREKREGNFGSAAADGSVPDDDELADALVPGSGDPLPDRSEPSIADDGAAEGE